MSDQVPANHDPKETKVTTTDPRGTQSPYASRSAPPWRWLLVVGAMVIAGVFIVQAVQAPWSGDETDSDSESPDNSGVESPVGMTGTTPATTSTPSPASAQAYVDQVASEQAAIAYAETTRILREGERALGQLDVAAQNITWWQSHGESLLTNDMGKRIASDLEQTRKFALLHQSLNTTSGRQDVESLRTEFESLLKPLQVALSTPGSTYRPSDSIKQAIASAASRASALDDKWSEHRQNLDALLLTARSLPPSSSTLLETINRSDREAAQRRLADIVAAEEAALDNATKEMAELRARLAEEKAESERRLAEAEAELEQAKIDQAAADRAAAAQRVEAQAERERQLQAEAERKADLIARAQSPDVKEVLAPFINPGNFQPAGLRRERDREPRPMSFGELVKRGSLEPTDDGLSDLITVVNNRYNTARGSWVEPSTAEEWAEIRRRQALLRELGPTMVELEMLSP